MRTPDGEPVLALDRAGQGRTALLLSDQIWLWSRGHDGGGPQAELLRRIAHWLMQEPDLEENALTARVADGRQRERGTRWHRGSRAGVLGRPGRGQGLGKPRSARAGGRHGAAHACAGWRLGAGHGGALHRAARRRCARARPIDRRRATPAMTMARCSPTTRCPNVRQAPSRRGRRLRAWTRSPSRSRVVACRY